MNKRTRKVRLMQTAMATAVTVAALLARPASAHEGGVSFWLPGNFGSLAAVPGTRDGRGPPSPFTPR